MMIKEFFSWNRQVCEKIGLLFPHVRAHNLLDYSQVVADFLKSRPGATVLDVGAGKTSLFVEYLQDATKVKIVGVDVSENEMLRNPDLTDRVVADVCQPLDFPDCSFDAIVSHSVLEHIDSQTQFFAEATRLLKPGGAFIHWIPNRFALFALLNQVLPNSISRKMIHYTWTDAVGYCGFPARYDKCYPNAINRLLRANGYINSSIKKSYYSSSYFAFFLPIYLVSLLYEAFVYSLKFNHAASYLLVFAEKPKTQDGERLP